MAEEPRRGPPVVEIVLPSYITKPAEDEKFYPSEVKAVAEKVSARTYLSIFGDSSTKGSYSTV